MLHPTIHAFSDSIACSTRSLGAAEHPQPNASQTHTILLQTQHVHSRHLKVAHFGIPT